MPDVNPLTKYTLIKFPKVCVHYSFSYIATMVILLGCCRANESFTRTVTLEATCNDPPRTQYEAIKYTDITSCECFNEDGQ